MKWCTYCKAEKLSYKDKGYSGTNYENRCWSCDYYTLEERTVVIHPSVAQADASVVRSFIQQTKQSGGTFEYKIEDGRRMDGTPYRNQSYKYDPKG